ncbi:hypothetical protein GCM10011571_33380 [Marinithermofilum abyssi]|uniref:Uncharacterized protein n=1 Tax=Marinithermofilum abyssi TaxID=1571185 RepID=A0A8J2VFG8_9BACL|nr:hypothetical protein [Marinithermofilum abyssi]GGE28617.1 hypothetical protein GCM10011571_33380 [Marinithermofilum abyssi]
MKDSLSVKLPADLEPELQELILEEWKKGGADRLGELLVLGLKASLLNPRQVAEKIGITHRGVVKAAVEAAEKGARWPRKNEHGVWTAPEREWDLLFAERKKRRRRKY